MAKINDLQKLADEYYKLSKKQLSESEQDRLEELLELAATKDSSLGFLFNEIDELIYQERGYLEGEQKKHYQELQSKAKEMFEKYIPGIIEKHISGNNLKWSSLLIIFLSLVSAAAFAQNVFNPGLKPATATSILFHWSNKFPNDSLNQKKASDKKLKEIGQHENYQSVIYLENNSPSNLLPNIGLNASLSNVTGYSQYENLPLGGNVIAFGIDLNYALNQLLAKSPPSELQHYLRNKPASATVNEPSDLVGIFVVLGIGVLLLLRKKPNKLEFLKQG